MTDESHARTADLSIAMFTVADQDAALAFYTEKLGFEVRGDTRFGENNEWRWLEVAPPGSHDAYAGRTVAVYVARSRWKQHRRRGA